MADHAQLESINAQQLRELAATLIEKVSRQDNELRYRQARIDQLKHEIAVLRRLQFAARSERIDSGQLSLLEDAIDADLQALSHELEALQPAKPDEGRKETPKRQPLPTNLPRIEVRHEPENTVCGCGCALKRIGEDVSEKLDYTSGVFHVERHIRGKLVCSACETLIQAPLPVQVIDKGIATAGLLVQVLVAKYADHQPLYRQEGIFGRAGVATARSTLAQWVGTCGVQLQPLVDALQTMLLERGVLHADETPVAMLVPGNGKTRKAYIWSYTTSPYDPLRAVICDFADGCAGHHARAFVGNWKGKLVCDDYAGYKALFEKNGATEVGCLAHAQRKFHKLWANHGSQIAFEALELFAKLYEVEREIGECSADQRRRIRQLKAKPTADTLHEWLVLHRQKVPDGTAIAKAIDYSLKRWTALTRYLDDGELPPDTNWVENRIRPIALGRSNWLFAGSLRSGKRAAATMPDSHVDASFLVPQSPKLRARVPRGLSIR